MPFVKLDWQAPQEPQRLKVVISSADGAQTEYVIAQRREPPLLFCIESVCPHSGGPLSKGAIETMPQEIEDIEDAHTLANGGCFVVCPWHSFRFSVQTGLSDHSDEVGHAAKVVPVSCNEAGNLVLDLPEGSVVVSVEAFSVIPKKSAVEPALQPVPTAVESRPEIDDGRTWPLVDWCIRVLNEPNPSLKIKLTFHVFQLWNDGGISEIGTGTPPHEPVRDESLDKIEPSKGRKLGKGGSLASRIAILHSLASIEQWAIDLAFDVMARYAGVTAAEKPLPREFFSDFLKVANDEAKHYSYLIARLEALGSHFGALPIHAGLWESAEQTSNNFLARLAVVHMVHEARGLDVNPQTISRFERAGDTDSVVYLTEIHLDEVTHVATGQKWFTWVCEQEGREKYSTFHSLVRENFKGYLKPPFNEQDRARAGLDVQYYMPLSTPM